MIPLIDLSIDKKTKLEIIKAVGNVLDDKNFILGSKLESFEKKFAKFIGSRFAVGVASGTDGIRLALRALGVGAGDQVLTVSFTSPFTVIAIVEEGATPVFVDVDENTWTFDTGDAEKKITKRARVIIPVHIYGNPCNMAGVLKLARKYKLAVVEDACQAHGALISNKKVGGFGDAAAFSFYPTKNLGAIGDGGAVTINSRKLFDMIKMLRHGGQTKRFWHEYKGINSRLDEIQAAVLEIKLAQLNHYNFLRSKIAVRYRRELSGLPIKFQESFRGAKSANHLFVIRLSRRNELKEFLGKRNILSDIYYPAPVHLQPAFKKYSKGSLKMTERLSSELLAIPLSPSLSNSNQSKVIAAVKDFFLA